MTDLVAKFDDYNDIVESRVLSIPAELAGDRLDAALAALITDQSRSRLSQWIKDGHVRVDGLTVTVPKTRVIIGQQIEVDEQLSQEELAFAPEDLDIPIVYQDDHILVVDKPAGMVTHPGSGNWSGTLLNGLLFHVPALRFVPRAGIVHRLDKDTSGLLVVAKTVAAQLDLIRQLQARTVKRHYRAIACGDVAGDITVNQPIGRDPRNRIKMAVLSHGGKPAITHVRPLERFEHHTLVECRLETGRTHQIRVHMAHIGCPLAADPVYGNPRLPATPEVRSALADFGRQALHAARLALIHPDSKKLMGWRSRIPDDMQELIAVLRDGTLVDDDDDWDEEDDELNGWEVVYTKD
ncbi:23S rRNA pseudouridine(1911/1915/1917) synthase RluD [Microvirgula aerodenitrificans]|uniref:Pseudouridine synthase n=1 Tax=Microvirgula aerodenitrificans TaxID=57480 RepID=A0A2U3THM1_9NEIS|nr:23S rRNA pseudouridine(1911/1915/1917) synthase RluD [Microvirgula aerodenitrificans]AVY92918.1 23S rRNA pseudouridine(1911/1915/1917) synthase RluD [Microvirgula aerodenitrificans]